MEVSLTTTAVVRKAYGLLRQCTERVLPTTVKQAIVQGETSRISRDWSLLVPPFDEIERQSMVATLAFHRQYAKRAEAAAMAVPSSSCGDRDGYNGSSFRPQFNPYRTYIHQQRSETMARAVKAARKRARSSTSSNNTDTTTTTTCTTDSTTPSTLSTTTTNEVEEETPNSASENEQPVKKILRNCLDVDVTLK